MTFYQTVWRPTAPPYCAHSSDGRHRACGRTSVLDVPTEPMQSEQWNTRCASSTDEEQAVHVHAQSAYRSTVAESCQRQLLFVWVWQYRIPPYQRWLAIGAIRMPYGSGRPQEAWIVGLLLLLRDTPTPTWLYFRHYTSCTLLHSSVSVHVIRRCNISALYGQLVRTHYA